MRFGCACPRATRVHCSLATWTFHFSLTPSGDSTTIAAELAIYPFQPTTGVRGMSFEGKSEKIWYNGKFVDWDKCTIHVASHVIHYGSAVFGGMRCYKTKQ